MFVPQAPTIPRRLHRVAEEMGDRAHDRVDYAQPQDEPGLRVLGRDYGGSDLYDWACIPLPDPDRAGTGRWLLMRRGIDDPEELACYLAYGPVETPARELIRIVGRRWSIEDSFEAAKGEVGLDEYEVRKWDGWHRHTTLCLLAHAFLVVLRSVVDYEEGDSKKGILSRVYTPN